MSPCHGNRFTRRFPARRTFTVVRPDELNAAHAVKFPRCASFEVVENSAHVFSSKLDVHGIVDRSSLDSNFCLVLVFQLLHFNGKGFGLCQITGERWRMMGLKGWMGTFWIRILVWDRWQKANVFEGTGRQTQRIETQGVLVLYNH